MLLDIGETTCIICGSDITPRQSLRLRPDVAGSGLTAVIHAKCADALDAAADASTPPSSPLLVGTVDGRNRRFELPTGVPDNAPVYLNGLCQVESLDYLRIGRVIVFHQGAPAKGGRMHTPFFPSPRDRGFSTSAAAEAK